MSSLPNQSTASIQPTNEIQTNENTDNNAASGSVTLVIIVAPIVSVIIIMTLTLLVGLAVCFKVRQNRKNEVSIDCNEAYAIGLQNMATYAEDTYDHPTMDQQTVEPFDIKGNEAYATVIETKGNEAYATVIETKANEAYATNTMIKPGVASVTKMHHYREEGSSNMERSNI